ncbi:UDP-N-acetylmuramoyl-L-alanine--D-glutamate ligase [Sphingomonas sp. NFR15]|uniref:UDP-N-acetylmuramoyl-L-alanine--D-glutamate ligase n=1 Tax=Sphingomonas sp. NFR15 TaxID=1566282 RepID=UPI00088EEBE3|nr:UDP-N-acetylmuramoyl-L-alanine--D-glutamate ligase [Sphingomonas sp. NFR15]SDA20904.1 UDP-N-acetylmuramoylalanine--D-glutamate ligase [Sphingomonas sp. NFR15]
MIASPDWRGKRFAVLGLARSGVATVRALLAGGAEVVAWDSDAAKREALSPSPRVRGEGQSEAVSLVAAPLPTSLRSATLSPQAGRGSLSFADPESIDLTGFDGLVVSPGVPLNRHPVAAKARAAGIPIIGDIELFAQARAALPPHKVVGITGTNGKSTTTALIHHILQTAGIPSLMGGNIGLPILAQEPLPEGGVYVLELSSYQIDLTYSLDCDVAVLLNITPDHLDRYDGFAGYAASKARLFAMQSPGRNAVVDVVSAANYEVLSSSPGLVASFIEDVLDFKPIRAGEQQNWPSLQGPHNLLNAQAAIEVCDILGVDIKTIRSALTSFTGLPHRMERIATRNGVTFVNDSKATNPESTAPALAAFDRIHWIVGGKAKGADLDACRPHFGHVARAFTIGDAGPLFASLLRDTMPVEEAGTLAAAVARAAAQAQPGDTVLLSPACASFDQFRDFEQRGDAFRAAVEALR